MNLDFFVIVSNLISLFILIAVGWAAVKIKILDENASPVFSNFLMKITLPCTIFVSIAQREYNPAFLKDGLTIIFAGLVIFSTMLYAAKFLAVLLRVPENCRGVWAFSAAFTNAGYMAFPITLALLGSEGLALAVMLNIAFNIIVFTIGAIEIAKSGNEPSTKKISAKSVIFSAVNFATASSLIIYFNQIKLPNFIMTPANYLANITTPISMVMLGIALAHSKFSELFTDVHAWTNSFTGLIIFPVLLCLALKFFTLSSNPMVSAVLVLVCAMPAASLTTVFTEMYHANTAFGAKVLFIQNLFCVITIPLICLML